MPIQECQVDGKAGVKWGDSGTCYPYTKGDDASRQRALVKANLQRKAIEASKHKKR